MGNIICDSVSMAGVRLITALVPDRDPPRLLSCTRVDDPLMLATGTVTAWVMSPFDLPVDTHQPVLRDLGDWHLPFIDSIAFERIVEYVLDNASETGLILGQAMDEATTLACKVSAARCSRMAYGDPSTPIQHDIAIYDDLLAQGLLHPMEHQATPDRFRPYGWANEHYHGNLCGWQQLRRMYVEAPTTEARRRA